MVSLGSITKTHLAHAAYRFVQLVLALAVCGLYGVDLSKARKENKYTDGKWVYAEVTASLSAFTAVIYMVPIVLRIPFLFIWDTIIFILWIALFGLFGKMYIGTRADDYGIQRMKNAVWVDLVNALLWLFSAVAMGIFGGRLRGERTRFTGRAIV